MVHSHKSLLSSHEALLQAAAVTPQCQAAAIAPKKPRSSAPDCLTASGASASPKTAYAFHTGPSTAAAPSPNGFILQLPCDCSLLHSRGPVPVASLAARPLHLKPWLPPWPLLLKQWPLFQHGGRFLRLGGGLDRMALWLCVFGVWVPAKSHQRPQNFSQIVLDGGALRGSALALEVLERLSEGMPTLEALEGMAMWGQYGP